MATKYESYEAGDNATLSVYGSLYVSQTFTPSVGHIIKSVKLLAHRLNITGTLTVTIRTTNIGKPTGTILATGTLDCSAITANAAGEWLEITLGAGYTLDGAVMYSMVMSQSLDTPNQIRLHRNWDTGAYSGGTVVTSSDSGATWTIDNAADLMFQEWGDPLPAPASSTVRKLLSLGML